MRKKTNYFHLLLIDHDRKIFHAIESITDDGPWTKKICDLIDEGRKVQCTTPTADNNINTVIESYIEQTGYKYSIDNIFDEPDDTSNDFKGKLPTYAENANRKRIVKILCRGECRCSRLAEMNIDYPGKEVLKKFDNTLTQTYKAKCLYCGYTAIDSYNWSR